MQIKKLISFQEFDENEQKIRNIGLSYRIGGLLVFCWKAEDDCGREKTSGGLSATENACG